MANEYVPGISTPTGAYSWIPEQWDPAFAVAAYDEMRVEPYFDRLPKPGRKIHIMKHANLARTAPADTLSLVDTLTYSGNNEVEVTAQPVTYYVAAAVNENTIVRMEANPMDVLRRSVTLSVSEGVDVACAAKIDDLVNVVGGVGQNITEATLLDGVVNIAENAKMYFKPGSTRGVFIFHPRQIDDVLASTQNWSQYQIRGDQDNPVSKGWLKSAFGFDFVETGNIQNVGGLFHNGLFLPKVTFAIGYNKEPSVKLDDRNLGRLVIGWVDFAVATRWDVYGVDYQTQTTA